MKQTLYLLIISSCLCSCATIMNSPRKSLNIYTTKPSRIVYNHDTLLTGTNNKLQISAKRGTETIELTAITDSLTKYFEIEPRNSFMYWSNIICNYGIGMLVERKKPKRYSYPTRIYLNSSDTVSRYYRYSKANNKGELHLHVSLPHINSFRMNPENESTRINTGFWGLTLGLDYYHSKNQFLNIGASTVTDFFAPFPAAIDISGEYELMSSTYFSVTNNHRLGRFSLGYGIAFASNTWDLKYYDRFDPEPPTRMSIKRNHHTLGMIFPVYYQLGEHFNLGLVYRPSFYRTDLSDHFQYEHLISIDFAWKFKLNKSSKLR